MLEEESASRDVYVWDGKTVHVESFDAGTSADAARLQKSKADLLIVRLAKFDPNGIALYGRLKSGPKGRRVVLVEFPAISVRADNGILWDTAWDKNRDGKPDKGAPAWLGKRNRFGDYVVNTSDPKFRATVVSLANKVAAAGFDGFVFNTAAENPKNAEVDARVVADVAFGARKLKNGYIALLRNPGHVADYPAIRHFLDGFVVDGLYYGLDRPNEKTDKEEAEELEERLEEPAEMKRIVLTIAYTNVPSQIRANRKRAEAKGFISLALPKRF